MPGQVRAYPTHITESRAMIRQLVLVTLVLALAAGAAQAQDAVFRVCTYNLLNYPGGNGDQRNPYFADVLAAIEPDIVLAQEINDEAGSQQFLNAVFDPALWDVSEPTGIGQSQEYLFFRSDRFALLSVTSIETVLRNIELYELQNLTLPAQPVVLLANAHLKASQGGDNEQQRFEEVSEFTDYMAANGLNGTDLLFCGDLNLYTSGEPAYGELLGDGEFEDPIDTPGNWHNSPAYAAIHTQSTRTEPFGGGATGGLDDRFDFLLAQAVLFDGDGWDLLADTYTAYGNDGAHFNDAINDGDNGAVPPEIADALHEATDHLPVFVDLGYWSAGGPVTLALVPAVPQPVLPPSGGFLEFTALITNSTGGTLVGQAWTEVTLPNGNVIGPVQYVPQLTLPANETVSSEQMQFVPGYAPGGLYTYTGHVGYFPNLIAASDGFPFQKLGGAGSAERFDRWLRDQAASEAQTAVESAQPPARFELSGVYPNPFNESATVQLTLPSAGTVRADVFDVTGRRVATLHHGALGAGVHRVPFDARALTSGVYIVRAENGSGQVRAVKALLLR